MTTSKINFNDYPELQPFFEGKPKMRPTPDELRAIAEKVREKQDAELIERAAKSIDEAYVAMQEASARGETSTEVHVPDYCLEGFEIAMKKQRFSCKSKGRYGHMDHGRLIAYEVLRLSWGEDDA